MLKKVKQMWDIINYPIGKDEDFDKECDTAFFRFLDGLINVFYFIFVAFAVVSVYFFVTHEVLQ